MKDIYVVYGFNSTEGEDIQIVIQDLTFLKSFPTQKQASEYTKHYNGEKFEVVTWEKISIDLSNFFDKEIDQISEVMKNRLLEKQESLGNIWKTTELLHLRTRLIHIYHRWYNKMLIEEEPTRLIDLANQAMLLYLRLTEPKRIKGLISKYYCKKCNIQRYIEHNQRPIICENCLQEMEEL